MDHKMSFRLSVPPCKPIGVRVITFSYLIGGKSGPSDFVAVVSSDERTTSLGP